MPGKCFNDNNHVTIDWCRENWSSGTFSSFDVRDISHNERGCFIMWAPPQNNRPPLMGPEACWRAGPQFFQEPKFLKNGSTEIFLDLIENRSNFFLRSKNQKFWNFWKIKIFIEIFRKIENPTNFRKIEKSKKYRISIWHLTQEIVFFDT